MAAALAAATLSGCFGYNSGAKGWSYVGDAILIAGGAAAIAADQETKPGACTGEGCPTYTPSIGGGLVIGITLVTAGLIGIIYNATRPDMKTSR